MGDGAALLCRLRTAMVTHGSKPTSPAWYSFHVLFYMARLPEPPPKSSICGARPAITPAPLTQRTGSRPPSYSWSLVFLGQRSRPPPRSTDSHASRAKPLLLHITFSSKSLTQRTCTPAELNLDHFLKSPCTPPPTTNPTKHPSSSTTQQHRRQLNSYQAQGKH